MTHSRKFTIDGYTVETEDPYLVEFIRHLLDKIETTNRLLRAFAALIEHDISVAANE